MNKSNIGKFLAVVAVVLSTNYAYNNVDVQDTVDFAVNTPYHVNALYLTDDSAVPVLSGPATAEVGELVRIHSGADKVKWKIVPDVPDSQEYGAGSLAISFREPGVYTIVAATLRSDEISLEMLDIRIGPPPAPVPDAKPDDSPSPEGLAGQITKWCIEDQVPAALAARVGENFKRVAESQSITSMDELIQETASLNKLVPAGSHTKVLAKLQVKLLSDPRPQSLEEYRSLWNEISAGWLAHTGV